MVGEPGMERSAELSASRRAAKIESLEQEIVELEKLMSEFEPAEAEASFGFTMQRLTVELESLKQNVTKDNAQSLEKT